MFERRATTRGGGDRGEEFGGKRREEERSRLRMRETPTTEVGERDTVTDRTGWVSPPSPSHREDSRKGTSGGSQIEEGADAYEEEESDQNSGCL